MEFVFAVEDRFSVRIPEDKLDPRQAGVTLDASGAGCSTRAATPRRRRPSQANAA